MQRVLMFLFVNGKCYGAQVSQNLRAPLTPIQKALNRLENGGLVTSCYEGKTRLYQFNPAFPLIEEVELLLKKAYTLLPAQEKKDYYVIKEGALKPLDGLDNKARILQKFWERLSAVEKLSFSAKTNLKKESRWHRKGKGVVLNQKTGSNVLVFQEEGTWSSELEEEVSFRNVFRWTLDRSAGVISLEHLRRGADLPVFLFHLAPSAKGTLSSVDAHLCGGDAYFGQVNLDRFSLRLNWRVIGPKKNEEIDYYYS